MTKDDNVRTEILDLALAVKAADLDEFSGNSPEELNVQFVSSL